MDSETTERRPRTASKEVRRRQLIEATITSIATHGVSGTTMATVTQTANLSLGIVSFHFKSKENLLKETLMFLAEEHRNHWVEHVGRSSATPEEKLKAIIDATFAPNVCTRERIAVWFAFFGEARYREIYREKVAQLDDERIGMVRALCRQLIAERGPEGADPDGIARSIEYVADGMWLNMLMYPNWAALETVKQEFRAILAALLPNHFKAGEAAPLRRVG